MITVNKNTMLSKSNKFQDLVFKLAIGFGLKYLLSL